MKIKWILLGAVGIAVIGITGWTAYARTIETPDYAVIKTDGDVEIRKYAPMIVAEATVEGEQSKAISAGFRIIADYIFGNNLSSEDVAMTSPVTQQKGEEIAMTSPVIQQPGEEIAMTAPVIQQSDNQQSGGKTWKVRFVMPSKYTMETLPKPVNPEVEILQIPVKRFAAIRFTGTGGAETLARKTQELNDYLAREKLVAAGPPFFAFYDPPWSVPFLRRNEVLVEIEG